MIDSTCLPTMHATVWRLRDARELTWPRRPVTVRLFADERGYVLRLKSQAGFDAPCVAETKVWRSDTDAVLRQRAATLLATARASLGLEGL